MHKRAWSSLVTAKDRAILISMLAAHNGAWKLEAKGCDVCYCIRVTHATLKGWLDAPSYEATLSLGHPMPLRLCKPHAVELDLLW